MEKRLTRAEFEVLSAAALGKLPQKNNEETKHILVENGYLKGDRITTEGMAVLEPYRAKRAVFMAAGLGERLRPLTINTPKPLVRVNGKRIIDTLLNACRRAGISEIYVVTGHLSEVFAQLYYNYPEVTFVDNYDYNTANNIGSVMTVRHLLSDCYVLEADLFLSNPALIRKYNYCSNVLGIWKEKTDDWCLTSKDGFVDEEKHGGTECYQMVGIYYLDKADGTQLAEDIETAYKTEGGRQMYWETVPNQMYRGKYKFEIIPCTDEDIVEIDTYKELAAIDSSYEFKD